MHFKRSKVFLYGITGILCITVTTASYSQGKTKKLFDGHSFKGWEGDTIKTWHIKDGALVGGSLTEQVPENNFLCTTQSYSNFHLKLKFKLTGTGFVNSGVQFNSKRVAPPSNEMEGYQADIGDGYWGTLYDESRRNKTLTPLDTALVKKIVKHNQWNDYEVWSQGGHIRIFINGVKTTDYTEPDKSIPQKGLIGLQIHGGGKAEVQYKDMIIQEL
ncbi:MAG: DUF1080 domain-containing protein [Agriterribacter sp.]